MYVHIFMVQLSASTIEQYVLKRFIAFQKDVTFTHWIFFFRDYFNINLEQYFWSPFLNNFMQEESSLFLSK